ncbi:MAG: hypothetical protein OEV99_12815 [Nitrospira sp.]|nr:hypothetical protein [Nitrospira sp.]MDH4370709.1 hypothetical protein [Nitrospira sp.]MDH5347518.1 hypothetical protein [Nitrospira sp.]MDH5498405.1 hypothetical protein [Nitrospira sp.]MDH5724351.1 hypothetical protein [Nitrospira sp.]
MILAGLFATVLFLGLIVGDWLYFIRLAPDAVRYGCRVAARPDQWSGAAISTVREQFTPNGVLMLPHGVAWFYPELSQIAIRPQYRFFSKGFRTAWPMKGLIQLSSHDQALSALCVKRIPWSSALITFMWFALVSIGSLTFVIQYAMGGGFASLGGVLVGVGIIALAGLVVAFGLVTLALSYRLEDARLMKVYDELRDVLAKPISS